MKYQQILNSTNQKERTKRSPQTQALIRLMSLLVKLNKHPLRSYRMNFKLCRTKTSNGDATHS